MVRLTHRISVYARPGLLLFLLTSCGRAAETPQQTQKPAAPAWNLVVESVPVPVAGIAASPRLTARDGRVILSWLALDDLRATLRFSERTDAGWSAPRDVIAGTDVVVNPVDVPSVRALADGQLVAHWLKEDGPDPESYRLPVSWSGDGGKSWSAPIYPHQDKTQTQHGFASLFDAPGGGTGVVWLDGRDIKPDTGEGSMALRAAVSVRRVKPTIETVIDPRVCECCQTAAALTSEGVIVAYRGRTADEVRDISVTRFDGNAWSAPVSVHQDGWKITGCPVNGPALDARGRDVVVAWFTAAADEGRSFVAFSSDAGRTFGAPIRTDDALSDGQVAVAMLPDGSAAVSWIEAGDRRQFRVRRITPAGARSPSVMVGAVPGTQSPRLIRGEGELVFAWTERGTDVSSVVRTARARLPR
jgi:hypothetical protein